jgi:Ribosomal protein S17
MLNVRKDFLVHDEGNVGTVGDIVRIESCRPMSKMKHFALAEIVQKTRLLPVNENEIRKKQEREIEQQHTKSGKGSTA